MAPHLVHQFWGSNSDAVSQLLVREFILAEQVEMLPGNRRAMVSDSKLNATESPKLFATEKKSRDIIVLLLE